MTEHPKHMQKLLDANEHARALLDAGYEIAQAQGPDYDGDGNEIGYLDRSGQPVERPALVWFVKGEHESFYIGDEDADAWQRAAHPQRLDRLQRIVTEPNMSREARAELDLDTAVALGEITKAEAGKIKRRAVEMLKARAKEGATNG